jgi:two-component system, OmpR family, response regulator ChvI
MVRIFLFDDNRNIVVALRTALQLQGYKVDMFDQPEIAFQRFSASKYDVAIVGAKIMPASPTTIIGGFELVRMIYKADKNTRILLMSESNFNWEDLEKSGIASKVDAFIKKPRGVMKLVSHIEALLKHERQEFAALITFAITTSLIGLADEIVSVTL